MELRHLRYFVTIAEELNFTRAAARLRTAQPSLTRQIHDLEAELGFPLFNRSTRRISLTQAGREFLPEAREVLTDVARLEKQASRRKEGKLGTLSISLVSGLTSPPFAELLRAFQKAHPGIRLAVRVQPSVWQLEALQSGRVDVGFLTYPGAEPRGLESFRIHRGPMRLAIPSGHPLVRRAQAQSGVDWKELAREPFILLEPEVVVPSYYDLLRARCREAGFEPIVAQYTNNIATQIWLASTGLGIAPVHLLGGLTSPSRGVELVALPKNAPVFDTYMTWKKADESPALAQFIRFARIFLSRTPVDARR